jgi:hypothetical protein
MKDAEFIRREIAYDLDSITKYKDKNLIMSYQLGVLQKQLAEIYYNDPILYREWRDKIEWIRDVRNE